MSDYKRSYDGTIRTHVTQSVPWWPEKRSLKGRPNVMYIVIDDMGYADLGCYGSRIRTPNIDALAAEGLRYSNFHVNAMCSPTRASLLSGCNHHTVGMGHICGDDYGFPAYRARVEPEYGMLSETLDMEGYATFALGKWHLAPTEECTGAGPYNNWPLGKGFQKFYGFLGACTSQFFPDLVNGNEHIDPPKSAEEGYHLSEDIANRAITYIGDIKSNDNDKPFFCYLAFGALHSPHQAPRSYIESYRGVFDDGWAACRKEILARQKAMGIVPPGTELCDDDRFVRDWDSLSDRDKHVMARFMESYAGFLTHTDEQIGKVIEYLKKIGQFDNTIIVCMSDNGASAEGLSGGTKNAVYHYATEQEPPPLEDSELDDIGTVELAVHYPQSWAHTSNTPFQMYKSWNHNGGIKAPLIITYPNGISGKNEIRSQYHHVVDIDATVREMLGVGCPASIKGVPQEPKHGVSMTYTFENKEEATHRHVQYYEMCGNRGIWADGWKAVADHTVNPSFDFSKDKWELYHTDEDFSEKHDLAAEYPEKLEELKELWWHEAGKYGVLPMLESHLKVPIEGFYSKDLFPHAPREPKKEQTIYPELMGGFGGRFLPGDSRVQAYASYREGDEGVLFSGGDNMGGYAMYVLDGALHFHFNWLGFDQYHMSAELPGEIGNGVFTFAYETAKDRKGGTARLYICGQPAAEMFMEAVPLMTNNPCFAVGKFPRVAVLKELRPRGLFPYTGTVEKVVFVAGPVTEEERMQMLARNVEED